MEHIATGLLWWVALFGAVAGVSVIIAECVRLLAKAIARRQRETLRQDRLRRSVRIIRR